MTYKIHTDIEQSRKLADILPLSTSDCYWSYDNFQKFHRIELYDESTERHSQLQDGDVPAWSLAALLNQLTMPILSQNRNGKWHCVDFSGSDVTRSDCLYDSAVDACVEMIEELHNKKLL